MKTNGDGGGDVGGSGGGREKMNGNQTIGMENEIN